MIYTNKDVNFVIVDKHGFHIPFVSKFDDETEIAEVISSDIEGNITVSKIKLEGAKILNKEAIFPKREAIEYYKKDNSI